MTQPSKEAVFCTNCGNQLNESDNFCRKCGSQNATTLKPTANDTSKAAFEYPEGTTHSNIIKHESNNEDVSTIEFRDLHPNAKWLFFLSYTGNTSIVLMLFVGGSLVALWLGDMFLTTVLVAATISYMITHYLAALIAYRHYQFEVTPNAFRKKFGILHVRTASIPFERVQNVNIRRTILDRILGLCHVDIETAGTGGSVKRSLIGGSTSRSEGHIPGVAPDEAEELKELILKRAQANRA